ncbi:MAG: hypothetical protein CVV02_01475 [Firmicutes bacterium HGW-Firmicutes-7]|nr:MAG: hypothetical protein CVV02_01475 [Firmicutes bacterium HGW-Firmicutes-7]
MKNNKNYTILKRILSYSADISSIRNSINDDFQTYKNNIVYKHAINMCIQQIGELSKHLTTEFKDFYSEIPWQSIRGIRNIFAHEYDSLDLDEIWATATKDIPELEKFCNNIVKQYEILDQGAVKSRDIEEEDELEL